MKAKLSLLVAIAFALFLSACDQPEMQENNRSEQIQQEPPTEQLPQDTTEPPKEYTLQEKQEYQTRVETKLNELDTEISRLIAELQPTKAALEEELKASIAALEQKKLSVINRFDELKIAGEAHWEVVKSKLDSEITELETAYQQIAARTADDTETNP